MDALLTNTTQQFAGYQYWDFQVSGDVIPIIYNKEEESQQATVLAYTQLNLIPQLPKVGVNWTGLLSGGESMLSIDTQIVMAISSAGLKYKPVYKVSGRNVETSIVAM